VKRIVHLSYIVPMRTKVHGAARLAGEAHVQVVGAAHDLPRPRLRLDVVLRDAHDAEEHHWHQHLAISACAWLHVSATTCHAWHRDARPYELRSSCLYGHHMSRLSYRCASNVHVLHADYAAREQPQLQTSLSLSHSPRQAAPASRRVWWGGAGCASAAGSSCAAPQRTDATATACAVAAGWRSRLVQPPMGLRRAAGHSACSARCAPSGAGICRSVVQEELRLIGAVTATIEKCWTREAEVTE
jgi:hypothetical protein